MATNTPIEAIKKAIAGDPENALIKPGTLAVTRVTNGAAAAIAASYVVMQATGFDAWDSIAPAEKIWLAVASAALWALGSAADAIARGIATTKPDGLVQLPQGFEVTKTEGPDEAGWQAVAVRPTAGSDAATPQWLIVKGSKVEWVATDQLAFPD